MTQQIEDLIRLQEVDCEIYQLESLKQKKPCLLEEKHRELADKKQKLETCKNELKRTIIKTNEKELTLKEKEQKVAKLTIQLNTVKTNKEYTAFMTEINNFKAEINILEDEILAGLAQTEELQKKSQLISQEITLAEKELEQLKEKVNTEITELDKELSLKQEQRRQLAEKILPEVLSIYNKLISNKPDKIALAAVINNICQGCFMDISLQEINDLLKSKGIICCRNCSRILYLKISKNKVSSPASETLFSL